MRTGIVLLCVASAACSGDDASSAADGNVPSPAPDPSATAQGQLPAGHPPIDPGAAPPLIEPPPTDSGLGSSALVWTAPAHWQSEAPSSRMRQAQYRVATESGEAEFVAYYFGPGQGGDAMSNALRWADQFRQPDGSPSSAALKTEELETNGISVLISEITGTYGGGMAMMGGPDQQLDNYMLLGAVAAGPDANWFFKFTGPRATIEGERQAFMAFVRSLRVGG